MINKSVFTGGFKEFLDLTEKFDDESYDRAPRGDASEFSDEDNREELEGLDAEDDGEFDIELDSDEEGHQLADILGPDELDDEDTDEFDTDDLEGSLEGEDELDDESADLELEFGIKEGEGHTAKAKLKHDVNKHVKKLAKVRKKSGLTDLPKGQGKQNIKLVNQLNNTGVKNIAPPKYNPHKFESDNVEMPSTLTFLNELMLIEKKKPLKKAAKAVYHRDYERTKKKPYRKYHPESDYVKED